MKPQVPTLLAVASAVLLASCHALGFAGGSGPALGGRTFLSISVTEGGASHPLVADTRLRLTFDAGRISASAGCNTMGATYRIDGDRLVVGELAMTALGCDSARAAQDDWLAAFLGSGPSVELRGDDLVLTAGTTVVRLVDREVAEPDLPLVGTTWEVTGILSGDTASSVPAGASASIRFDDAGRFNLNTGCNSAGGSYQVDGSTIRLSELLMTAMACPGAKGELETAVLKVLRERSVTNRIEADSLTLTAGDQALQLHAH
ncbi:MAG TPA: META domain-containing protein [Candidatus Limnocylindrales bacterium]|jgi:heat shock protein HslJ|nr:META domain-containing protein [Candidatus Limnocylindrales bacterium]